MAADTEVQRGDAVLLAQVEAIVEAEWRRVTGELIAELRSSIPPVARVVVGPPAGRHSGRIPFRRAMTSTEHGVVECRVRANQRSPPAGSDVLPEVV